MFISDESAQKGLLADIAKYPFLPSEAVTS